MATGEKEQAETEAERLRETLREVLEEWEVLDYARGRWHCPGTVRTVTMDRWRSVAGLDAPDGAAEGPGAAESAPGCLQRDCGGEETP